MQRTPHRCPHCSQLLALSSDMWGFYYVCGACGWTCEDDDQVPDARRRRQSFARLPGAHPDLTPAPRRQYPAA